MAAEGRAALEPNERLEDVRLLKRGSPGNADIYAASAGGGPVIVKDFTAKSFLVRRLVGPLSVRREARAYRALVGVGGIAELHETGHPLRLAVTRIDGTALSSAAPGSLPPAVFVRLGATVSELHRRGLVHLDLAHRGNIILAPDGTPWLIDLASCLDLSWLGPIGRMLARTLGFFDRASVAKWKQQLCTAPLDTREARDLNRLLAMARLWLPNRKTR